jgi:hypothetical protein
MAMARLLPLRSCNTRDKPMDNNFSENDMRTAIRHAGAIAMVDRSSTLRETLNLANDLYEALIDLEPRARARRIRLLDDVFGLTPRQRNS